MFGDAERLAPQDFFKCRTGGGPDRRSLSDQLERPAESGPEDSFCRSQGPVKINLAKHVVAGLEVFFNRIDPPRRDVDAIALLIYLKRIDNPLEIIETILCPGHKRIAQQIIHSIYVELRGNKLAQRGRLEGACDDRGYAFR